MDKSKKPLIIRYCECGQAVRNRKKDKTWTHTGYKRMHEPYSDFLKRTKHPVKLDYARKFVEGKGWYQTVKNRGWVKENIWGEIK